MKEKVVAGDVGERRQSRNNTQREREREGEKTIA